jgi:hypothetical protein
VGLVDLRVVEESLDNILFGTCQQRMQNQGMDQPRT